MTPVLIEALDPAGEPAACWYSPRRGCGRPEWAFSTAGRAGPGPGSWRVVLMACDACRHDVADLIARHTATPLLGGAEAAELRAAAASAARGASPRSAPAPAAMMGP